MTRKPELSIWRMSIDSFQVTVVNHWDCPADPTKEEILAACGLSHGVIRQIGHSGISVFAVKGSN